MAATRSDAPRRAFFLRPLTPGDEEAAWALRRRALEESPDAFGSHPDEHPPLQAYRELQAQRRRSQEQRLLGAFMNGDAGATLVGVVTVVRSPRVKMRHRADLFGLYVAPEARREGVGRALVAAAVRAARDLGAERLELAVTAGNDSALRLYREAGFETWGVQPCALRAGGRELDEAHMALALQGS